MSIFVRFVVLLLSRCRLICFTSGVCLLCFFPHALPTSIGSSTLRYATDLPRCTSASASCLILFYFSVLSLIFQSVSVHHAGFDCHAGASGLILLYVGVSLPSSASTSPSALSARSGPTPTPGATASSPLVITMLNTPALFTNIYVRNSRGCWGAELVC